MRWRKCSDAHLGNRDDGGDGRADTPPGVAAAGFQPIDRRLRDPARRSACVARGAAAGFGIGIGDVCCRTGLEFGFASFQVIDREATSVLKLIWGRMLPSVALPLPLEPIFFALVEGRSSAAGGLAQSYGS